jgi:hypothetical protein
MVAEMERYFIEQLGHGGTGIGGALAEYEQRAETSPAPARRAA